jgi:hypothetical protein
MAGRRQPWSGIGAIGVGGQPISAGEAPSARSASTLPMIVAMAMPRPL